MKIGIFDSGLGGLIITKAIIKELPEYNYVYLGDTKRVPYGNRPQKEIYKFTKQAVNFLFQQNCQLVILACNTASAMALRKIQQEFLPKNYPDRRVLGVIIPTAETVGKRDKKIGVLATTSTAKSHIYKKELFKINRNIKVFEQAAPVLVSMIENNTLDLTDQPLRSYLKPLQKEKVDDILLGCTHYPILKKQIQKIVGSKVKIISQEEIIPDKLKNYLKRHPEIKKKLDKHGKRLYQVTALKNNYQKISEMLFGKKLKFEVVKL